MEQNQNQSTPIIGSPQPDRCYKCGKSTGFVVRPTCHTCASPNATAAPPAAGEAGERLRQIRERLAAATPGKWECEPDSRPSVNIRKIGLTEPGGCWLYDYRNGHNKTVQVGQIASLPKYDKANADAEFIAHAPEDIRFLLARLHAAEAARDAHAAEVVGLRAGLRAGAERAARALENCYEAVEWPADGTSEADMAALELRMALAQLPPTP